MDYSDLTGLQGQDNQGGLTQEIYYAPLSYFVKNTGIKGFKAVPSIPGVLEVDGPHVFNAGKGFHAIYATLDSSKYSLEGTGERDGRGFMPKVEFFHPGGKKASAAFARQAKNDQFIVLVKTPNGETYQIGSKEIYAEINPKYDSGTLSSGRNGNTFEITSYANGHIFYDSAIELFPAPVVNP